MTAKIKGSKAMKGRYSHRPLNGKRDGLTALGRWRVEKKVKLKDLAAQTGQKETTVSKHCTGLRRPTDPAVIEKYRQITDGAVTAEHWYGTGMPGDAESGSAKRS